MSIIYIVCFFAVIGGLLFWSANNGKKANLIFRIMTIGAVLAYILTWFFQVAPTDYKLEVLMRDFLVISAAGAVFTWVARKRKLFVILLLVTLGGGYLYFKTILQNTFPFKAFDAVPLEQEGELLLELKPQMTTAEWNTFKDWADNHNISYELAFYQPANGEITDLDDYYLLNLPNEDDVSVIKKELRKFSFVDWVEDNEQIQVKPIQDNRTITPIQRKFGINDPGVEQLWSFEQMQMDKLYALLDHQKVKPAKKALVAILDTGVDSKHEDIQDNYKSVRRSHDNDPRGHGTHCAGIAGAVSNNGKGVASYSRDNAFVQITSVKVLNSMGYGNQKSIIDGIIEAADKGADVISMSLGGPSNDTRQRAYSEAVAYANKKGAIVVAAAGNSNMNSKDYSPVNAKGIIGVSAVDQELNRASFSNIVKDLKFGVAAPGVGIYSTIPKNQYATYNGTSMATPYVSGLIGLMKSIRPDLKTEEAYTILNKTGINTGETKNTGHFIQPYLAIEMLLKK